MDTDKKETLWATFARCVSLVIFSIIFLFSTLTTAYAADFTIDASAGAHGSIDPAGSVIVTEGTDQAFSIVPDSGYEIDTLVVDGSSVANTPLFIFTNVAANHTIDATFVQSPNLHTITTSAGSNGCITPDGVTTVTAGDAQSFTITPDLGFQIDTVTIDGATTTPTNTVSFTNITAPHTIAVTFTAIPVVPGTHDLTATAGANGTITPSGVTTVTAGDAQSFTITPDLGFQIDTVTIDGATTTPTNTVSFTNITAPHTIDVTFKVLLVHTITATAGVNGTISPGGVTQVFEGSSLVLTVTPDAGFVIQTLIVDSLTVPVTDTVSFTNVSQDHTIFVSFVATHTITTTLGSNGSSNNSGTVSVTQGTTSLVTITPDLGFAVKTLIVDGATTTPTTTVSFTNIAEDHTVVVTFAPEYHIVVTEGANGTISPSGTTTVIEGADQSVTIVPDSGFAINTLTIDGITTTPTTTVLFTNVTQDHTIAVTFVLLSTHTITTTTGGNGSISSSGTSTIVDGQNQTYVITPDFGFTVGTLVVDGVTTTPTTTVVFTGVVTDHTIDVTFVPLDTHVIVATAGTNGLISPSGTTTVFETYTQVFTITPQSGYGIDTLLVDGVSTTPTTTVTFTNVTAPHTIAVTFKALPVFTITASKTGNGSISPEGLVTVFGSADQTFSITPLDGNEISSVVVDGVVVPVTSTFMFTNVVSTHTIHVVFTEHSSNGGSSSGSRSKITRSPKPSAYLASTTTPVSQVPQTTPRQPSVVRGEGSTEPRYTVVPGTWTKVEPVTPSTSEEALRAASGTTLDLTDDRNETDLFAAREHEATLIQSIREIKGLKELVILLGVFGILGVLLYRGSRSS